MPVDSSASGNTANRAPSRLLAAYAKAAERAKQEAAAAAAAKPVAPPAPPAIPAYRVATPRVAPPPSGSTAARRPARRRRQPRRIVLAGLAGTAVLLVAWLANGARDGVDSPNVPAVALDTQPPAQPIPAPAAPASRPNPPAASAPSASFTSPPPAAAPAIVMASRVSPPVQRSDGRPRPASVAEPPKSAAVVRRPAEEWLSPRLMKLGVRAGWRAAAIDVDDPVLVRELQQTVAQLAVNHPAGNRDVVFLGVRQAGDLARIERVRSTLKSGGVLWVLFSPRSAPTASEIVDTAQTADLALSRRVALSPTCDALSFVSAPASQ